MNRRGRSDPLSDRPQEGGRGGIRPAGDPHGSGGEGTAAYRSGPIERLGPPLRR